MSDLRALAEQYVRLSSEIEGGAPGHAGVIDQRGGREPPFHLALPGNGRRSGEAGCGGGGGGEDPGADPGAADADVGDRAGDGGGGVDDDPAEAKKARRERGRDHGAAARTAGASRLSAAETADLIAPGPRPVRGVDRPAQPARE